MLFNFFLHLHTCVPLIITFQSHERSVTKQLGPCGIIESSSLLRLTLAVEAIGNGVCDVENTNGEGCLGQHGRLLHTVLALSRTNQRRVWLSRSRGHRDHVDIAWVRMPINDSRRRTTGRIKVGEGRCWQQENVKALSSCFKLLKECVAISIE